ncbi:MAG: potassium transporter Kef [Gammaproteobacteria bacterium SG8_47]|nr:MAG: potassium transporter Kef [Gammaproteobacteria bacterium SG8_47]
MNLIWIGVAFVCGMVARAVGLPPMVGFLAAGFILQPLGVVEGSTLTVLADWGVTLLLFTIGLKLRIGSLLRPEVWAVATGHMVATVVFIASATFALAGAGVLLFAELDWIRALLIGFALSFSSTVFAVKVLEDKGEMASLHGRTSVGILITQDIFAVMFLVLAAGKIPSPYALGLLALIPLRPLLLKVLDRVGHGELLVLYALLLALGGARGFELLGVKGDLGAIVLGILMAPHPKASELAHALLNFKDIFLIGFFLTIGLHGLPEPGALLAALLLLAIVPLKVGLFFALFARFGLRVRTATLASLSLANYSEFGLIVGAVAVKNGWLSTEWLVTMAVAVALSFVAAAPLNVASHRIYARVDTWLRRFERAKRLPYDRPLQTGDAEILVFGMGRIGGGAYEALRQRYGRTVLGLDYDAERVQKQRGAGRNVGVGDATDTDFWEHFRPDRVKLVLLALPNHKENLFAAKKLIASGFSGKVAAIARFPDEIEQLRAAGVNAAFNVYAEAGAGFADHVCETIGLSPKATTERA